MHACTALSLLALSSTAVAKSYKSGEFETTRRYGFGAFEARIRCAQGPGVISTFFLWRPGSETSPTVPWHEIDFEMGQLGGDYQTQIMTPGASPPMYRTEHVKLHTLPSRAWQAYYTYRMEWTPTYIAFFVDGKEVRRETDTSQFAELFHQDASGDTPIDERMELRTGVWPGNASIAGWSGNFDGSTVPTAHFVDYVKVWDYTPTQANKFATLLLDDEFNSLNTSNWYAANWTFDFSASDYVAQNIGTVGGRLVVALTTDTGQGKLPKPPADVPYVPPTPLGEDGIQIEAEDYDDFNDTTAGNQGSASCSTTDVDAEPTADPAGGGCNVGWTAPGEWLEYDLVAAESGEYALTVRLASASSGSFMHVEVDGVDVSGPLEGPGAGWQAFRDAVVPSVAITSGPHVIRLVFETGLVNVNYFTIARAAPPPTCAMSCDDGNACTTDRCDATLGCVFENNTASCADDGNSCTADVCSAGACTHPANGSCSAHLDSPCTGLCTSPKTFSSASFSSGNLGSGAACYETTAALRGGVCGNLASSRKLSLNGVAMPCGGGNWPAALPAKRNGGYCVQTTAGDFPWAYFSTW
ncbi:MAG TPA: family 16 glycosylhydrolase [Polyangiaceae bacterium]|nr:family 16 glycosylhydrolase [Polyangiaceae bacterium]